MLGSCNSDLSFKSPRLFTPLSVCPRGRKTKSLALQDPLGRISTLSVTPLAIEKGWVPKEALLGFLTQVWGVSWSPKIRVPRVWKDRSGDEKGDWTRKSVL